VKRYSVAAVFLLSAVIILLMPVRVFSSDMNGEERLEAILRSVSPPQLVYPNNTVVRIVRNEPVRFQWVLSSEPLVFIDYIEFSLYRGKELAKGNLIFSKRFPKTVSMLEISPSAFSDNQVYTWLIRQVFLRGDRSNERLAVFMVLKKSKR